MEEIDNILGRDFKSILVTGDSTEASAELLQMFLNKHKNLGLRLHCVSPEHHELNVKGYKIVRPFKHLDFKVNVLIVESDKYLSEIDFTELFKSHSGEVENILIVTCLCVSGIDKSIGELFDTVIDLNVRGVENACERL